MVEPEKQRSRYISNAEGAPPVPPPGGYHGAKRTAPAPLPAGAPIPPVFAQAESAQKQSANAIGWIALITGILFAVTLLGTMLAGLTDVIYGVTMLTLQLVVLAVVIAALFSARGRVLGAS